MPFRLKDELSLHVPNHPRALGLPPSGFVVLALVRRHEGCRRAAGPESVREATVLPERIHRHYLRWCLSLAKASC
jgi:hypothetical protein